VFEILLPCCLTDDSGSGARGGGISGCEGDLPGEILTTGMFISTFCGLSVLFKSTLPGTLRPDQPYPPSSEDLRRCEGLFLCRSRFYLWRALSLLLFSFLYQGSNYIFKMSKILKSKNVNIDNIG
jgi:hypothetical protein